MEPGTGLLASLGNLAHTLVGAVQEMTTDALVRGVQEANGAVFEDGVSMIRSMLKANFKPQWLYQTSAPSQGDQYSEAIGVERPRPSGAGYEFEHPVRVVTRDGTETVKFADLYKEGCFLLEAKDELEGG